MPIIHEQEEIRPEILVSFAFKVSKFFFFYIADVSNTYVHCDCVLETVTLDSSSTRPCPEFQTNPGRNVQIRRNVQISMKKIKRKLPT